jgi:hypothetical protein
VSGPFAWVDWWKRRGEDELALLLWAVWDPTGVSGLPRDEYESYAPQVASRLRSGTSAEEVAALLGEIRTGMIGDEPHPHEDLRAAWKICDWYEQSSDGVGAPPPSELR